MRMTSNTPCNLRKVEKTGLESWGDSRFLRHLFSSTKQHRNAGKLFHSTAAQAKTFKLESSSVIQSDNSRTRPNTPGPPPGSALFPSNRLRLTNSTSESAKEVPSQCLPGPGGASLWLGKNRENDLFRLPARSLERGCVWGRV